MPNPRWIYMQHNHLLANQARYPCAISIGFFRHDQSYNYRIEFNTLQCCLVRAPPDQAGSHDGTESVDSLLINPAQGYLNLGSAFELPK